MEEDDMVLSDVHVWSKNIVGEFTYHAANDRDLSLKLALSRFPFDRTIVGPPVEQPTFECVSSIAGVHSDEDGDLDVPRRRDAHLTTDGQVLSVVQDVVTIEHSLASPLPLVGLQVWLGAMLLSDYILHLGDEMSNSTVLELGAGTGLCSIVSSIFAKRVICTDVGSDVLSVCQRNVDRNGHLCRTSIQRRLLKFDLQESDRETEKGREKRIAFSTFNELKCTYQIF